MFYPQIVSQWLYFKKFETIVLWVSLRIKTYFENFLNTKDLYSTKENTEIETE